jgi:hypothetical protein
MFEVKLQIFLNKGVNGEFMALIRLYGGLPLFTYEHMFVTIFSNGVSRNEVIAINTENLKRITDKDLMVFLVAKGMEIKKVNKDQGKNRSLVYFEKTKDLENAVLSFTNKSEEINVGDYIAAERRVKTLLNLQKLS